MSAEDRRKKSSRYMEVKGSWAPKSQLRGRTTCACLCSFYRPKIKSNQYLPWRCPIPRRSGILEKALWEGMERDASSACLAVLPQVLLLSAAQAQWPSLLLVNSWPEEQLPSFTLEVETSHSMQNWQGAQHSW